MMGDSLGARNFTLLFIFVSYFYYSLDWIVRFSFRSDSVLRDFVSVNCIWYYFILIILINLYFINLYISAYCLIINMIRIAISLSAQFTQFH